MKLIFILFIKLTLQNNENSDFLGLINLQQALYTGEQNLDSIKDSLFFSLPMEFLFKPQPKENDNIHTKNEVTNKGEKLQESEFSS